MKTLEARVAEVREEVRTLEILNRTGASLASELSLERLVQMVTDAGVELSGAEFGAFFYNVIEPQGEAYLLYTLSGGTPRGLLSFSESAQHSGFRPHFRGDRCRSLG